MAISLYELSQRISSSMPLGTIVPYYGTDEPSGWKICDGRSCAGSELAKKLGISNVPDLRGRFIRMIGGNAAGMGVAQEDCIRNITGGYDPQWTWTGSLTCTGAVTHKQAKHATGNGDSWYTKGGWDFDASRVVPTGPENRPINMAFNYIIKVNTNVILYYVSNIIYKAIAIGKSLLSKTKEEVRRTMAISLKNHEDRITKLESLVTESSLLTQTVLFSGSSASVTLKDSIENYDCVVVYSVIAGDAAGDCRLIPKPMYSLKHYCEFGNQLGQSWYALRGNSISLGYNWGNTTNIVSVVGLKWVATLKQYYCFSNNILLYRLTQILFNSPFFWN